MNPPAQPVPAQIASAPPASSPGRALAEVWLIFLIFFIHAGWPAPDVNEPNYLSKAKHYWSPEWCANDLFLESADVHEVFYFTFGWVTRFFSLPATAWIGRVLTWGLLAWSWRRLSAALIDGWLFSVLSAALFVVLNSRFHMAGEWVVGGVEAKSFAYVFFVLGIEAVVRNRWGRALMLFGAASAFHVIVGGWAVACTLIAWRTARDRPPARALVLPAAVGGALAIGGLWPGVALTLGVDRDTIDAANRLYVYQRLSHHLLPQNFPPSFVVRHLLLAVALVPLAHLAPRDGRFARLTGLVAAAVGIAAIGMLISASAEWFPDIAAALLRYYWFRASDVFVPLGVALLTTSILSRWQQTNPCWFLAGLTAGVLATGVGIGETALYRLRYLSPRADWTLPRVDLDEWRQVCDWAAAETPIDAQFLVPRMSQTFRWYAGRAEVVSRKELPQDAPSIVAWWNRMADVYPADVPLPPDSLAPLGADRLRELGTRYGAAYVVTRPDASLALPRVGPQTRTIAVYRLSDTPSERIISQPVPR